MEEHGFPGVLSNTMCQTCETTVASHFCKCTNPPLLFCLDCCGPHHTKYPRSIHQVMPIATLSRNPEVYIRKTEFLAKGAAELRKNIQKLEKFSEEFDDLMRKCANYLAEYRSWFLLEIQREKEALGAAIEAAVQETTLCLDKGLEPESALAQAIWTLPPQMLQLVSYSVVVPDISAFCQACTTYKSNLEDLCGRFHAKPADNPAENVEKLQEEPSNLHSVDTFAAIYKNTLEIFALKGEKSTKRTLPIDFGWGGSYILLDSHSLLCFGSDPPSNTVFTMDLSSFQFTSLAALLTPRAFSGVIRVAGYVYVFGGYSDSSHLTKSCEMYELQGKIWFPLGDMSEGRSGFTPCVFLSLVYLPCVCVRSIETFNPETQIFATLPISLPAELEHSLSVAFVNKGELCVITESQLIARWRIGVDSEFRVSVSDRKCCSSQLPLVKDSFVLIANNCTQKVMKFSLETYAFI